MRRPPEKQQHEEGSPAELLKAVAQAWHAQSGNRKPTDEFHARRRSSDHRRPSRFKLEAVALAAAGSTWDFAQSLWDSYEIVTLSKKLEEVDLELPEFCIGRTGKRSRESQNSLRSLLLQEVTQIEFRATIEAACRGYEELNIHNRCQ